MSHLSQYSIEKKCQSKDTSTNQSVFKTQPDLLLINSAILCLQLNHSSAKNQRSDLTLSIYYGVSLFVTKITNLNWYMSLLTVVHV